MAATQEANTPPEVFNDSNTDFGTISKSLKQLDQITKSVAGNVRTVTSLQKDFTKLQDLTNSESKVRKSIRKQEETLAKTKAKFTTIQLKTIKSTGKK